MANITRVWHNMVRGVARDLMATFLFIPLWNLETLINTGWSCQNPRFLFFFLQHILCEKLSTFYITNVLSLLLQEKGNTARNRRISTKAWSFFCSQILNSKASTTFPDTLLYSLFRPSSSLCTSTWWPGSAKAKTWVIWPAGLQITTTFPDTPSSPAVRKLKKSRQE